MQPTIKPWNATFDDCTNGSLVESCLVHAACDNGANCPPQVIDYVSLFGCRVIVDPVDGAEIDAAVGRGRDLVSSCSFKGCGGSAIAA